MSTTEANDLINFELGKTDLSKELKDLIASNLMMAHDQSEAYETSKNWKEGDEYMQNTSDSCIEAGYSPDVALDASDFFYFVAKKLDLRFA